MIDRLEASVRKLRRTFSRSEWAIRLLDLPVSSGTAAVPGLMMVQLDGLGRSVFEMALARGRMPFLRRLMRRERYVLHTHYSGVPASTPAVQAELFYGVKGAVPAFNFLDRATGKVLRMYDRDAAAEIERRLQTRGAPLLEGGSAYTNIFSGGAAESHFCASTIGWRIIKYSRRKWALPLVMLLYADVVIGTLLLMAWELVLAAGACAHGIATKKGWREELPFILTRIGIVILLRELVVISAKIDLARGLPIVHVNFIGYDEQAHRRGPSTRFAEWALPGIDGAVRRIWQAADRSGRRHYDVWIYSDHGQQDAVPYPMTHGASVQHVVAELFGSPAVSRKTDRRNQQGVQSGRAKWLGGSAANGHIEAKDRRLIVTGMGSLGHIYPPAPMAPAEIERMANALVHTADIPLVLTAMGPRAARAWTPHGEFTLPDDTERLFGAEHPFVDELGQDLVDLCHHPDAGALVISGWRRDEKPYSFPMEFGSHTGPGVSETRAFALLPRDAPLPRRPRDYVRPWDLREGVHRLLGRAVVEVSDQPPPVVTPPRTLRIMTYNIHACIGMDGKLSPERIARVIARHNPDVVALQEVDIGRARTGHINEASVIARRLQMEFAFQSSLNLTFGQYGNAVLSRYPLRVMRAGWLPRLRDHPLFQPRSALWVELDMAGAPVQLVNVHLSLWPRERLLQVDALLGADWLGHPSCREPVILCGDLNSAPDSAVCRRLSHALHDAQRTLTSHRPLSTWWGRYQISRIDHVFIGSQLDVVSIEVPNTELDKVSSDHLPLIVEVRIPDRAQPADADRSALGQALTSS